MQENKNFDQEILDKIRQEKIQPRPKWYFTLRNFSIWAVGALAMVIGALSFSVIIYMLKFNDWDFYSRSGNSFIKLIFVTLPYFWLFLLAGFIALVYFNIKRTKRGYRWPLPFLVIISISLSMLLGSVFYSFGFAEAVDDIFGRRAPFYDKLINPRMHIWMQPEQGRLAGLVISHIPYDEMIVLTKNNLEWYALLHNCIHPSCKQIKIGYPIRLFGKVLGDRRFEVLEVLPMGPGREFMLHDLEKRNVIKEAY